MGISGGDVGKPKGSPPRRQRVAILEKYAPNPPPEHRVERFTCDGCSRVASKHSAACYAQKLWEKEGKQNFDVSVAEDRVNFNTCPKCLDVRRAVAWPDASCSASKPIVVSCAGAESHIIGGDGSTIRALERKFRTNRAFGNEEFDDDVAGHVRFELQGGKCYVTGRHRAAAAQAVRDIVRQHAPSVLPEWSQGRTVDDLDKRRHEFRQARERSRAGRGAAVKEEDENDEDMDVHVVSADAVMAARCAVEDANRIDLTSSSPDKPDGTAAAAREAAGPSAPLDAAASPPTPPGPAVAQAPPEEAEAVAAAAADLQLMPPTKKRRLGKAKSAAVGGA